MWICPKCEAMNKGAVCDICGEKKPISEKKKKKLAEKAKAEKRAQKHGGKKKHDDKKKMSLTAKIIIWVVSSLLIAGIGVGGYFLLRDNSVDIEAENAAELIIQNCREAMAGVDNLHFAAVNSLNMHTPDEDTVSQSSVDMSIDLKNKVRFMTVGRDSGGEQSASQAYVKINDNNTVDYYMGDGSRWIKMDNIDQSQLDGSLSGSGLGADFEAYFNAILDSGIVEVTRENVEGKDYYIISSQVYVKSMEDANVFGLSSFTQELAQMAEDPSLAESLIGAFGPVYVTLYIDCETYLPFSCIIELKPALSTLYLNIGFGEFEVNEAYCSMIYNDFNKVGDVKIPPSVLNAPKYSDAAAGMAQ